MTLLSGNLNPPPTISAFCKNLEFLVQTILYKIKWPELKISSLYKRTVLSKSCYFGFGLPLIKKLKEEILEASNFDISVFSVIYFFL